MLTIFNLTGLDIKDHVIVLNEACSVKSGLHAYAKSIDPCQPAHSAQADMGRNFLLPFLQVEGPFYIMVHLVV